MAEKEVSTENRAFRRIPAELSLRFFNLDANKWRLVKTCDISAQGVGLLAQEELSPKTRLEMWLSVPESAEPIYSKGSVVWSRRLDEDKYKAGVKLDKPDLIYRILDEESLSVSSPLLKSLAFQFRL